MPGEDRRSATAFERHAQTIIAIVMAALLTWVALTVQSGEVQVAQLAVKVDNLNVMISAPDPRLDDLTRRIENIELHAFKGPRQPTH